MHKVMFWGVALLVLAVAASSVQAATPGRERGATSQVRIEGFDPLIPTLRKWYVPQDLYYIYHWGGYKYTNYSKEPYQRYVRTSLEARASYDIFGNWITRALARVTSGVSSSRLAFGSTVFKDAKFSQWFQNLIVAADSKGQYYSALTVGDQIRTTLTPADLQPFAFQRRPVGLCVRQVRGHSAVVARQSARGARTGGNRVQDTDFTNFVGLRGTAQVGDFMGLGLTYVNTNFGSASKRFLGKLARRLADQQPELGQRHRNHHPHLDDSPGDGSGALFFSAQMIVDGQETSVNPTIEGGRQREGFLEALEEAPILLRYRVPDPLVVQKVSFAMVLSND